MFNQMKQDYELSKVVLNDAEQGFPSLGNAGSAGTLDQDIEAAASSQKFIPKIITI